MYSKYKINTLYVSELMSYLNINSNDYIFPEGNCYIGITSHRSTRFLYQIIFDNLKTR